MTPAKIIISLAVSLLCMSCDYDNTPEPPPNTQPLPEANTTISSLHELYAAGGVSISQDLVIKGIVTTTDSCSNFYKCMMIQDETGGAELRMGIYDIYTMFRRGEVVSVKLKGLAIGMYNGSLQIGTRSAAGSAYEVDYINSAPVISRHITRGNTSYPVTPPRLTISQINASHLGQLVEVTGGSFTQGGIQTWSGEKTYSEKRGVSIPVYTNSYATFADDILPAGKVALRGIVTRYADKLQLKLSSPQDAVANTD